jgi:hypothetical protein
MNEQRSQIVRDLDEIVCGGIAHDVFSANQSRLLLEALDDYVRPINDSGTGKCFFAALQIILKRDLYLVLCRLYEPSSNRNPGRTIPSAIRFISENKNALPIVDRHYLIEFFVSHGITAGFLEEADDTKLSDTLASFCAREWPRFDGKSSRPLDAALCKLKAVRDKWVAHHDRVDCASLIVPAWENLAELISKGRVFVKLIAQCYLGAYFDLDHDAERAKMSMRRLLARAGVEPEGS